VTSPARQRISPYEYFQLEQHSTVRHEYLDGVAWALAGGTPDHSRITANIIALLSNQLRGKPCQAFESNLKIAVRATGLKTYPDVSVICGRLELDPDDQTRTTAANPTVLVEVLSRSTEEYDRGEKLDHYKKIPSLMEVVLVSHDDRRIEVWRRNQELWVRLEVREGAAELPSIGCRLPLDEVYRDPLV
jgi:Uma2 family endonuclease